MMNIFYIFFFLLLFFNIKLKASAFENFFDNYSFYGNASASISGLPLTDEIPPGAEVNVDKITIVPSFSVGVARKINDKISLSLEYGYTHTISNETETIPPSPASFIKISSNYDLQTKIHSVYLGAEYSLKKFYFGSKLGINYVDIGGDLVTNIKILNTSTKAVSNSEGKKYRFGIKLNGGYNFLEIKNVKIGLYSEYMFILNKTRIDVSAPKGNISPDLMVGYPTAFHSSNINQGSLGIRISY